MASEDGVRATNDDATQCKRFAVERGYWKDPYISLFGQRGQQAHAPEISIGYYARVQGLRILLNKFLSLTSCACQVVSLGAGYDTTYWNLKDQNTTPTAYVEVDFASVTSKKIHFIRRSSALLEKISNEDGEIQLSPTDLHSQDYHLVAANLKNISELEKKLKDCGIDRTLPTLFLSECVLVYIETQKSDALLKWIAEGFSTAFFINYEQVNMGDRFGEIMQDNLRVRDCLLHTEACASLQSQMDRVEKISMLDERELLDQLMSHYCYCWAYKDPGKLGLSDISMY